MATIEAQIGLEREIMKWGYKMGDNNIITINDVKKARRRMKQYVEPTLFLLNSKIEKMIRKAYPELIGEVK